MKTPALHCRFAARALTMFALTGIVFAGATGLAQRGQRGQRAQREERAQRRAPAPIERRPPSHPQGPPVQQQLQRQPLKESQRSGQGFRPDAQLGPILHNENPGTQRGQGEHLAGWMNHHSALSLTQQQQALDREPGFRDLPSQTQQRMRDRLTQLNNMPPEKRAKIIGRAETMEKLTPDQRSQFRSSVMQMTQLPPDRRHAIRQSFMSLRDVPPSQRQAYLNSPEARSRFSDAERQTLSGLISAEPYPPAHE